jgi:probable rRNA maturation factor
MSSTTTSVDIRNFTRRSAPGFPYKKIAEAILPNWDISLVFCGEDRAQNLNVSLRGKDYVPNVLSYETGAPLAQTAKFKEPHSGEIIICLPVAKKQAQSYGLSYPHFTVFLFIHGLLHLKGMPHGTTMERHESTFLKRFTGAMPNYSDDLTNHGSKNSNRH